MKRLLDDGPLQGLHSPGRVTRLGEQLPQLHPQGEVCLAKRLPARRRPVLISVLGEKFTPEGLERG